MEEDAEQVALLLVEEELFQIENELERLMKRQEKLIVERESIRQKILRKENTSSVDHKLESNDFRWSSELDNVLKSVFHISELRPYQLSTMNAVLNKQDCILIMPTGGGKSLCFQVPALLCSGITLVVSPLISLMEDQIMALKALQVDAEMLSGSTSKKQHNDILKAMVDINSTLKILYVTPERLKKSKNFMSKLEKMYEIGRFSLLAVDEVHCCSQWGHDFRPDYKILGIMKQQFPSVPILGLTATATTSVTQDVQKMINIEHCLVFRASFNRPNLVYKVVAKPPTQKEALNSIAQLVRGSYRNQSGIIYCFSIKESEEVAADLTQKGVAAQPYHANLEPAYRSSVHREWVANKCQVVVATVAFGMGIDKPDVRFVMHHSLSKSMENYYQESGRAGRDGKPADCIVFYRFADAFRNSAMVFQERKGLSNLYTMLQYCIEKKRCRRSILADHFGERWQASHCSKKCDNCNFMLAEGGSASRQMQETNVKEHLAALVKIIEKASSTKQRLTALKLTDAWLGKGSNKLHAENYAPPKLPRTECDRILAHLLIEGYLKEEFHFTAYSTISYITKGPRSSNLLLSACSILMDIVVSIKKGTVTSTAQSSESVNQSKNCWLSKDKPAPNCVVNHSVSKLTKSKESAVVTLATQKQQETSARESEPKVEYLSSDTDVELDFAEWNSPKKQSAPSAVEVHNDLDDGIDWDEDVFAGDCSDESNKIDISPAVQSCGSSATPNLKRQNFDKKDSNAVAKRLKL